MAVIEALGVEPRCGERTSGDVSLAGLRRDAVAVIIAAGAKSSRHHRYVFAELHGRMQGRRPQEIDSTVDAWAAFASSRTRAVPESRPAVRAVS